LKVSRRINIKDRRQWRNSRFNEYMAKITYIESDGSEHAYEVAPGLTVKDGAMTNDVPGILAQCGGACACATCQVYVDPAWVDKTGVPSESELAMLEFVTHPGPGSRLSCQITVTGQLDGLVVRLPVSQD
jgi:2Fe-2S ferredoxin